MRRVLRAPVALMTAGIFTLQVLWAFAVPAFAGVDEVDHAYRAASVAEGYWAPPLHEAPAGRGDLIRVPTDIVAAANKPCTLLAYSGHDNCLPASEPDDDGNVLVASAAATYNPVFYWIVGTVAEPFEGAAALYAMRLATAVLSVVFIGCALWVSRRFAQSWWPTIGVLTAVTPVVLYATSVAAPNGVQMCAGLLMWTSATALLRSRSGGREPTLFALVGGSAAVVLGTHTSGPMWVVLSFVGLVVLDPRRAVGLWRTHSRAVLALGAWIAIVAAASLGWVAVRKTNLSGDNGHFTGLTFGDIAVAMTLWVFQSVGGLPFRNEWVSPFVFAISLMTFAAVVIGAMRYAQPRQRVVMAYVVVLFFAVPVGLTLVTYAQLGLAWQGRYALPFAFGLPVIAAAVLDERDQLLGMFRIMVPVGVVGFVLTQTIAIMSVLRRQAPGWPHSHTLAPPPDLLVAGVATVALALIATAMLSARRFEPAVPEPVGANP